MRIELAEPMNAVLMMAEGMQASLRCIGKPPCCLAGITNDSREVRPGDMFVALRGSHQSGSAFLKQALQRGAAAIALSEGSMPLPGNYWLFTVKDTAAALLNAAAMRREKSCARVIAISGSAGKTTVKETVSAVLAADGSRVSKSAGNYNSTIGMPLSLLGMSEADYLVSELGINHPGEMAPMSMALRPHVSVLTNIGTAHLGNFQSMRVLTAEKLSIAAGQGEKDILLLSGEVEVPPSMQLAPRILYVGMHEHADFRAVNICMNEKGTRADIMCKERVVKNLVWHVPGSIGISVLAIAAAIGMLEGKSDEAIRRGLEAAKMAAPRMRLISVGTRSFLDDTYNASPEAVKAAIEAARLLAARRPLVAVLGDMLELGELTVPLHNAAGAFAAAHGVRQIFAYGKYAAAIAEGARTAGMPTSSVFCFEVGEEAALVASLLSETPKDAFMLFKASRKMALNEVLENTRRGL